MLLLLVVLAILVATWGAVARLVVGMSRITDYMGVELTKNDSHRAELLREVRGMRSDNEHVFRSALRVIARERDARGGMPPEAVSPQPEEKRR